MQKYEILGRKGVKDKIFPLFCIKFLFVFVFFKEKKCIFANQNQ